MSGVVRRTVLVGAGSVAAASLISGPTHAEGTAQAVSAALADPAMPVTTGTSEMVKELALRLAAKPFAAASLKLPPALAKITYDQYRDIRFRPDQAIWRGEGLGYELQLFAAGWLYTAPVEIHIVGDGPPQPILPVSGMFQTGKLLADMPPDTAFALSGFRVHAPINRPDYLDEYVVFQGASYLRAVARGQQYGLSSRGLAIDTGQPKGEEFPFFRAFYIEKPRPGAVELVVHALLDSPSCTGAYRFSIRHGIATVMDVEATILPRGTMRYVGLAPLTSMFLQGPASRHIRGEARPSVHDSQGLVIWNGKGEWLWRQLTNPRALQASAFLDKDPKGFGLEQRDRAFSTYEDLEASYQRRPSLWIEPRAGWGAGTVELIELPTEEEIHDNIVAFWRPSAPLEPGAPHALAYRMTWADTPPGPLPEARVHKTLVGPKLNGKPTFAVDFAGSAFQQMKELPVASVEASAGKIENLVVQLNPSISGIRCAFELQPETHAVSELRLTLKTAPKTVAETWLYRWIKA
jgi:glucans biosynthesis protein